MAFGLFLWFYLRAKANDPRLAAKPTATPVPSLGRQPAIVRNENPVKHQNLGQMRQQHNLLIAHKIRPIPMTRNGQNQQLTIAIEPRAVWCKVGDLDTIKAISQSYTQSEYSLALESLGRDQTVQSARLSLKDMFDGKSFRINLPTSKGNQILTVSLCRSSGQARCQTQMPWNPGAPLSSLDKSQGVLLYTQILLRTAEGLFLIPSDNWDDASLAQITNKLKDLDRESVVNLKKSFAQIQIIRPLPALLTSKGLSIPLTYNDPLCLQGK